MKLISMTDFVLEQTELYKEDKISVFDFALRVKKYAKFLKQPLKLEMFVPCVNGEPLPVFYSTKWYKAKEKVLFDSFEGYDLNIILFKYISIESLQCVFNNIKLTNNALKQIGI